VVLAKERFGLRGRDLNELGARFVPFTAATRMSGVDLPGREIRKGSPDAIEAYVAEAGGEFPLAMREAVRTVAEDGGTPLLVAEGSRILGTVWLKDIVKGGIKERFAELRRMGIKTVMVTGDNALDRRRHRRRGRSGRLPGRGQARNQAPAHPGHPGRGPARGHDRRRHQRLPRPWPRPTWAWP